MQDPEKQHAPTVDENALFSAVPREKPYKIFPGARGVYLIVQPNGGKHWRYRIRRGGLNTTLSLGAFPEVTLAEALEERDRIHAQACAGLNPADVRRAAREVVKSGRPPAFAVVLSDAGALSLTAGGRTLHLTPAQTGAVRAALLTETEGDTSCP